MKADTVDRHPSSTLLSDPAQYCIRLGTRRLDPVVVVEKLQLCRPGPVSGSADPPKRLTKPVGAVRCVVAKSPGEDILFRSGDPVVRPAASCSRIGLVRDSCPKGSHPWLVSCVFCIRKTCFDSLNSAVHRSTSYVPSLMGKIPRTGTPLLSHRGTTASIRFRRNSRTCWRVYLYVRFVRLQDE